MAHLPPPALKKALRRELRKAILSMAPADRQNQQTALERLFPTLPGYSQSQTVLLYVTAFPEELDTSALLDCAKVSGKDVLCPRVDRELHRLRLFEVRDLKADLGPGVLGIPEPRDHCREVGPDAVDWVLVPGLAFDDRCYRLGRGAGHYDRLLPRLRSGVERWALGFDCQVIPELPVEPHDVALDGIVTPGRTIRAGKRS